MASKKAPAKENHDTSKVSPWEDTPEAAPMEKETTPVVAKVKDKKEKPAKAEASSLPMVSLQVYLRVCGRRWDQMRGFEVWAKRKSLKLKTIPDWHKSYDEFMGSPTV